MSINLYTFLSVIGIILSATIIVYIIIIFNNIIVLKNLANKAHANIEVLLKQRFDELPNIIQTVKGYMKYESETLLKLTNQRSNILNSDIKTQAKSDNKIKKTLKNIFARTENYPKLKSNKNFLKLQKRIKSIESDISDRRSFYNECVNNFNNSIQTYPNKLLANLFMFKKKELFKINQRKNIEVEF